MFINYNSTLLFNGIPLKCPFCVSEEFSITDTLINCELGYREFRTICRYCGNKQSFVKFKDRNRLEKVGGETRDKENKSQIC